MKNTLVRVRALVRSLPTRRGDRGQGTIEYIGILAVVVTLVVLIAGAFTTAGGQLTTKIASVITSIVGL